MRRTCAAAVALALATPAWANPTGPSVVSGQATFQTNGKTLTVTNAPGTIIHWNGFSIAADELTRFLQQSPLSSVLNRVVGANPSEILGRLQSNGRVFLINPNGIVFGPGSQVDVAGLAASSLNISNADFLSGRHVFSGTGAEGRVVNQGEILTPAGGRVLLVAPQVENQGVIRAPSGEIVLAAGSTVRLVDASFPAIQVEVSAQGNDLALGNLAAAGKVFAFLVRQSGTVSASSASVGDGGRVVLKSAGDVQVAAGARTEATGASGGSVALQATQAVVFAGSIDVRGTASSGGAARIEAREITAFTGTIDARGVRSGGSAVVEARERLAFAGTIFVGAQAASAGAARVVAGELVAFSGRIDARSSSGHGGVAVVEAPRVLVAYSGSIDVSGSSGGGRVTLVGEEARFAGTIVARAERSGDGGAIEVSGRRSLVFTGSVDTRAVAGRDGNLLIDPARIEVVAGSTGTPASLADGTWSSNEDSGTQRVGAQDLTNLLRTTSVTLQATDSIQVAGDAAVESSVAGRTLTLEAPRVVFQGSFRAVATSANLAIRASSTQVTQGARVELNGGRLDIAAPLAMVEPAASAQRPATAETLQRAVAESPDVQRLRSEVQAEIARENARIAEAMTQSCGRPGAPRQGCTVGGPPRRFAFAS